MINDKISCWAANQLTSSDPYEPLEPRWPRTSKPGVVTGGRDHTRLRSLETGPVELLCVELWRYCFCGSLTCLNVIALSDNRCAWRSKDKRIQRMQRGHADCKVMFKIVLKICLAHVAVQSTCRTHSIRQTECCSLVSFSCRPDLLSGPRWSQSPQLETIWIPLTLHVVPIRTLWCSGNTFKNLITVL